MRQRIHTSLAMRYTSGRDGGAERGSRQCDRAGEQRVRSFCTRQRWRASGQRCGAGLESAGLHQRQSKNFTLALLELARRHEREVCFDYRCDSPRLRRFMRAHLSSDSNGMVHFSHEHLYSESFAGRVIFKTAAQRGRDTAIRCSLCNHVRHDGLWKLPEFVSQQVFGGREVPVIYGVCPSCLDLLEDAR